MGNESSSNRQRIANLDGVTAEAVQQALAEALIRESNADREQNEVKDRLRRLEDEQRKSKEVQDRLRRLEEEQRIARERQQLEYEKKKNEELSPTKASENGTVGSSLSRGQTEIPLPQAAQSNYEQPKVQSTQAGQLAGQAIEQHSMGHLVGVPMKAPNQVGPMMGASQGGPMMGPGQTMMGAQPAQYGLPMGAMQGGMMTGSQQIPTTWIGTQSGGQSQPMMGNMGMQPGSQMAQSMMGPTGHPMMGPHPAQMSHSMGPQQFHLQPSPGQNPLSGPQLNGPAGFGFQQGPMGHPDFNLQFQPPIGRMGPQMPYNRSDIPHPYRRGPQPNNNQNNNVQNNQGGPRPNQNQQRRNQPSKQQPRARSSSREKNGPQNRSNPLRQNKADAGNKKQTANQGAIPKQKPFQPNANHQKTKNQPNSGLDKSLPYKNNEKKKTPKEEKNGSEKSQETGVPKTKKEKNPLFSNKASKTSQRVDEYLKSMRNLKPEGSKEKTVFSLDDLMMLNSENPELWNVDTLAKLFGKDDDTTKQQNTNSSGNPRPVPITDLAQMFEPEEDSKPVGEPKVPNPFRGPTTGPQNQPKKGPAIKKFNNADLRDLLDKMNLLSTNESKTAIDLKTMIEKIKVPTNSEQQKKDQANLQAMEQFLSDNFGDNSNGPQRVNKNPKKTRSRGLKKKQMQQKKKVQRASDDSESSEETSDSDSEISSVSKDSFKTAVGAKQPLVDQDGATSQGKTFLKHLTPGELPPLSKANPGKKCYLNLFIGKKIPSKREAHAQGVKTAQLYRKVQGVVVFDAKKNSFDFPKTIIEIIEFGEKNPDAVAHFTSDFLGELNLAI